MTQDSYKSFQERDQEVRDGRRMWYDAPSAYDEWAELPEEIGTQIFEHLKVMMQREMQRKEREIQDLLAATGLVISDLNIRDLRTTNDKPQWKIEVTGCKNSQRFYNKNKGIGDQMEFYWVGGLKI